MPTKKPQSQQPQQQELPPQQAYPYPTSALQPMVAIQATNFEKNVTRIFVTLLTAGAVGLFVMIQNNDRQALSNGKDFHEVHEDVEKMEITLRNMERLTADRYTRTMADADKKEIFMEVGKLRAAIKDYYPWKSAQEDNANLSAKLEALRTEVSDRYTRTMADEDKKEIRDELKSLRTEVQDRYTSTMAHADNAKFSEELIASRAELQKHISEVRQELAKLNGQLEILALVEDKLDLARIAAQVRILVANMHTNAPKTYGYRPDQNLEEN